jgi:anti-anti-sigma factor
MIESSRMRVRAERGEGGVVLRLEGELDISSAPQVEQAVESQLAGGARQVVIDLRALSFIDSSGLRLFILLSDRARSEGWELRLIRPGEPTIAVFRLTGAEENLPFVEEPQGQR